MHHIIGDYWQSKEFSEFNRCPIYLETQYVGKEYWILSLIFIEGSNPPCNYCLRLYKGVYQGDNLQDEDPFIIRIDLEDSRYLMLPDTKRFLTKEELLKLIDIINNNCNNIILTLQKEKICLENSDIKIHSNIPDYSKLPTSN